MHYCSYCTQLQGQMMDLQGEKVALETQLATEKAGNRGLETLLATERKKARYLQNSITQIHFIHIGVSFTC